MGIRDLEVFREAGRALFSLGLVKGSEGNLSRFDGTSLVITRTGAELSDLADADVLEGSLDAPPEGSSSDLQVHLAMYRERGAGAFAHAHPSGSPLEGGPGEHGEYAFADTLASAVSQIVARARDV